LPCWAQSAAIEALFSGRGRPCGAGPRDQQLERAGCTGRDAARNAAAGNPACAEAWPAACPKKAARLSPNSFLDKGQALRSDRFGFVMDISKPSAATASVS
jgi:hypothetical protein